MSYRHAADDKQVLINAMTGKVHGERRLSAIEIAMAILAALFVVFVLLLLR